MRISSSTLSTVGVMLTLLAFLAATATWLMAAQRGSFHPAEMPCEADFTIDSSTINEVDERYSK